MKNSTKKSIYIITGANGHVGNALISSLMNRKDVYVRGLVLPSFKDKVISKANIQYFYGDIKDTKSLYPLFKDINRDEYNLYLIHTAAIVSIQDKVTEALYDVNVKGTKNILDLAIEFKVDKFIYLSSVHALKEEDHNKVIYENSYFDPNSVKGGYAKTKAMASNLVLDYVHNKGLKGLILHPSGIIGPYFLDQNNHLIKLINDYLNNKLPCGVSGGYDFVDVRDVVKAILSAIKYGRNGETYIISNRHYEIKDIFNMINNIIKHRKIPIISRRFALIFIPLINLISKLYKKKALYTKYSLYTLGSNDNFSHDKATIELKYAPRDIYNTLKDTIEYLKKNKKLFN